MKLITTLACSLALVFATTLGAVGTHLKTEKPLRIAQGMEVSLTDFLVPQKFTVFDFTSEYCPPCRGYTEPLLHLHQQRADVAVIKVDINRPEVHRIDWQSPVAQQYGMRSIPHFKVYGPQGDLLAEGDEARAMVDGWIAALPQ